VPRALSPSKQGEVAVAGEPSLLLVGLAEATIRQGLVERRKVSPQLVGLARHVGQNLLPQAARRQHQGVTRVPAVEVNLQKVENGGDDWSADMLVPRDLPAEGEPSVAQLSLKGDERRASAGAPHAAPGLAGPVGQVLAGADHGQMLSLESHAVIAAPGEGEAVRASDRVRVLAAGGSVAPRRLLLDHLLVSEALLGGPQPSAPEGTRVRRREVPFEAAGGDPAPRARGTNEIGEGSAGAQLGGHAGGGDQPFVVGDDHGLLGS
jgi:hypothetical protein